MHGSREARSQGRSVAYSPESLFYLAALTKRLRVRILFEEPNDFPLRVLRASVDEMTCAGAEIANTRREEPLSARCAAGRRAQRDEPGPSESEPLTLSDRPRTFG